MGFHHHSPYPSDTIGVLGSSSPSPALLRHRLCQAGAYPWADVLTHPQPVPVPREVPDSLGWGMAPAAPASHAPWLVVVGSAADTSLSPGVQVVLTVPRCSHI